jgi:hypothetical protein
MTNSPVVAPARVPFLLLALLVPLLGCGGGEGDLPVEAVARDGGVVGSAARPGASSDPTHGAQPSLPPEQEAFWAALQAHCGQAYAGEVSDITEYYRAGLEGRRAVIHFFECSEDRIHIPFHVDDNRSRNWILTRVGGTIRLKHDHRHEDGTEEDITQYGGDAPVPGLATRQIFPADEHTARSTPLRFDNFWFLDFVDPTTLQYGVHWPKQGHSIRFSFDLSSPVPPPPAPWGY